ncbi:MAG: ATP-binding protein [Myxococcales bacterium]|nr:ATP-binding protein [Myxococcales bacterium]
MSATEVQALLERLVAQFASPYDFLRELVQNSMDAGSDRVEVVLDGEPTDDGDGVVHVLSIADTGGGMDEAIIDGELTRLFASTKSDDRTMAGGFGIGFVSVFAWQPDAVLVQTGRAGEGWEVVFYPDRRFEKRRLQVPVEGTTVTLLRRGPASEGPRIAEAVRDSLWRWCRYCRLEITFEDLTGDQPLELIQDSPAALEGELGLSEVAGDHAIRVAFGVPPRATLLRRGLILAEGSVGELLPELAAAIGEGREHLQVWVDSPSLHTTLARDKVMKDAGHGLIERRIIAVVDALRGRLVAALVANTAAAGPWTSAQQRRHAFLHGHLARERGPLGPRLGELAVLRELTGERAITPAALGRALAGRPLLHAPAPDALPAAVAEALGLARAVAYPVIAGDDDDRTWLRRFAADLGIALVPVERALATITPIAEPEPAAELVRAVAERSLLRGAAAASRGSRWRSASSPRGGDRRR